MAGNTIRVTLDDDIAVLVERRLEDPTTTLDSIINDALRIGLTPGVATRTEAVDEAPAPPDKQDDQVEEGAKSAALESVVKLDDKGRITLPDELRGRYEDVVIVNWQRARVAVFGGDAFEAYLEAMTKAPGGQYAIRALVRDADEQTVDRQGRLALSSTARAWAGLECGADAVVTQVGDHLEVCSPA